MILICKETVNAWLDNSGERLFTAGVTYEFVKVNNRYSRANNFVGYVKKDDEGEKRWLSREFKDKHFVECKEG